MIYCSLEDGKDMGRFSFNGAGTSPFFTAAEFPNLFQEAAENRCIGLKILLFEQVEEFFAGQADPHFFREGKARVIRISTMKRKMEELTQLPEVRGCGGGAGLLFSPQTCG